MPPHLRRHGLFCMEVVLGFFTCHETTVAFAYRASERSKRRFARRKHNGVKRRDISTAPKRGRMLYTEQKKCRPFGRHGFVYFCFLKSVFFTFCFTVAFLAAFSFSYAAMRAESPETERLSSRSRSSAA